MTGPALAVAVGGTRPLEMVALQTLLALGRGLAHRVAAGAAAAAATAAAKSAAAVVIANSACPFPMS